MDFSVEDKRQIALALDTLGMDYIEGGWPGANPTDTAFFAERAAAEARALHRLRHDQAVGPQRRQRSVAGAGAGCARPMRSAWSARPGTIQVDVALEIPREENIDNIARSIEAVVAKKREPLFDAEHFFDGYKANPDYALACIKAAHDAGARWLVLCDTNGGTHAGRCLSHRLAR